MLKTGGVSTRLQIYNATRKYLAKSRHLLDCNVFSGWMQNISISNLTQLNIPGHKQGPNESAAW